MSPQIHAIVFFHYCNFMYLQIGFCVIVVHRFLYDQYAGFIVVTTRQGIFREQDTRISGIQVVTVGLTVWVRCTVSG